MCSSINIGVTYRYHDHFHTFKVLDWTLKTKSVNYEIRYELCSYLSTVFDKLKLIRPSIEKEILTTVKTQASKNLCF